MWKAILAALLTLLATKAMRGQTAPATGSIGGQVINVATGLPVAGAAVMIHIGHTNANVGADPAGRYFVDGLPPGSGTVAADDAERTVILHAGEDLTSFDLHIRPKGKISGKVVDADGKPLPNMYVYTIAREYRWGSLRYFYADSTFTDARGQFHMASLEPGRGYLLMVRKSSEVRRFDPAADSLKDPTKRKPVIATTFYPGVASIEDAAPIVLRPGEVRDDIDLTVVRSTSFCVDGKVLANKDSEPLYLRLEAAELNNAILGDGDNITFDLPGSEANPSDRAFRVCGLPQGQWRFTVTQGRGNDPTLNGSEFVSIADADIHDLTIIPRAPGWLTGEVAWDGGATDQPDGSRILVELQAIPARDTGFLEHGANSALPGRFSIDKLPPGDYAVDIKGVPDGVYLQDVSYGSRSVLYESFFAGSEPGGTGLRVIVARDGGFIQAKSAVGSWITIIPVTARTETAISATHISGETDQSGIWKSPALAPDKYYVLATSRQLYMTPETVARIMVERLRADPVEVAANATVAATVTATNVEQ